MRNTAELICGTEKNLVKEALIVTGPDELVTAADPVIEKLDDELRALEIRIKANTEQQKVLDGLGGMINRLETDLNAAGERNKELALSEQNLVTVLTMLRKHVEEFQRKLEGQNAVEIENNLQSMKTRKSELDQEAIDAKKALERFQNQNASLNSAAEALKKQIQGFEDIPEKELSETMEYLETEKAETSKLREKIHSSWHNNLRIYEAVCGQQGRMEQTEKEYVWIHSLADTAGGTLNGKSKVELETYVQMAYFDRILRRANLRLMTMSSGQYEMKRRESADNKKDKSGLELNVIDHYNGSERSVKTLSGGETFQASLSLALGLSDEIQSMAGGIQMDAMFVDEGFGSLDEDALNQAVKHWEIGRREKTGWHHFSCFRVERQDRQENCNNKKSQRGESRKQHNGSRGLFSRWGVSIYVKTLGANGKRLPTENKYLWNHDRCLCKFVFLRFPGF